MLLSAAVLAGCGDPSTGEDPSSSATTTTDVFQQQRTDGVNALLGKLDKALLRGGPTDLAPLLDASASPEFRRRLQVMQANLSSAAPARPGNGPTRVRYRTFEHYLGAADAEELVPDSVAARLSAQGSSDNWVTPVRLRFALGGTGVPGLDEPDVEVDSPLVVARYDDDWKLVGDMTVLRRPAGGVGLWSFPGVRAAAAATAGGQSVIASYPGAEESAARVAALLPGAVRAVSDFWGSTWPRRALVVATATPEQFTALAASGGADVSAAAAATVYTTLDVPNHTVTGQRIVLTPAARDLSPALLDVVLRHELSHVAVRLATRVDTPQWLAEGVPEYVGRKGTYTQFADAAPDLAAATRTGTPPAWPSDEDFTVDSARAALAYQSAWSIAAFVAQRYSEDVLRKLYLGVAGAVDDNAVTAAFGDSVGIGRAELERQWQAWVRKQSGG
ncbi:peptidase MA family metallohydrolase [Gordonia sp. (in: high G+C Gram-positive bacteria)]|uniref:peptidase MA family metallohydrolase n=1 Tax=Gordonia sp. (in: high G+C Gram-positive bacteria) TaxID=84139 RepID=UPI0039E68C20